MNVVVIFTSIIILLFAGVLAYSKAYKIKNRIIEVIEKHEDYNSSVLGEIQEDLRKSGYMGATMDQINAKCGTNDIVLENEERGYLYCVYLKGDAKGMRTYEVVTYIHFDFPVIGDMLTFAVRGETKTLGKNYNY